MRKVNRNPSWTFTKTRRTDFTREEMLDILDFYLQYKPLLEDYSANKENGVQFDPFDFTLLLYMYGMVDVDYINNMNKIKKKYGKQHIDDMAKEKLDFLEVITVFTAIHRIARNDCYNETYEHCIEDNVFYNLLCRLEEIKNELEC